MHFWIDKRSYGFGRSRVAGQYPRRLLRPPTKPWSTTHRTAYSSSSSTPNELHAATDHEPVDDPTSPSYLKYTLWAIAITLSTFLVYIVCDQDHQLFTFCVLLAIFFLLGACTVFRRTPAAATATAATPPNAACPDTLEAPAVQPQAAIQSYHQQHNVSHHHHRHHHHNNHHHNQGTLIGTTESANYVLPDDNRSPSISIHNLAESPTPTYHNSHHNQV